MIVFERKVLRSPLNIEHTLPGQPSSLLIQKTKKPILTPITVGGTAATYKQPSILRVRPHTTRESSVNATIGGTLRKSTTRLADNKRRKIETTTTTLREYL
jgi:hypothetical protein